MVRHPEHLPLWLSSFMTVTSRAPRTAVDAAVSGTVIVVPPPPTVAVPTVIAFEALLEIRTVAFGKNPVPVIVYVTGSPPAARDEGLTLETVGGGETVKHLEHVLLPPMSVTITSRAPVGALAAMDTLTV